MFATVFGSAALASLLAVLTLVIALASCGGKTGQTASAQSAEPSDQMSAASEFSQSENSTTAEAVDAGLAAETGETAADTTDTAAAEPAAAAATPADPKWPIGSPGPNGGIVYSVGSAYMEVTRPDKAHYYYQSGGPHAITAAGEYLKEPPAPWRVPTPAELTQVYNALQKAGLADYGNYWYQSNKMRRESGSGKGGDIYNVTFVRLKDGAAAESDRGSLLAPYSVDLHSEDGTAMGRVIYVRSFDPSKPPAKVAAGKPVAPPLPAPPPPPVQLTFKPCPYPVGSTGPKGGVVYQVGENKTLTECTYTVREALAPANAVGPNAVPPAGWYVMTEENDLSRAQKAGLKLENRWYLTFVGEAGIYWEGKWGHPAYSARLHNPVTGEMIDTYHLEGETEYNFKEGGSGYGNYVTDPALNALVLSAPRVFGIATSMQAEVER
jgi:hypothetical protein